MRKWLGYDRKAITATGLIPTSRDGNEAVLSTACRTGDSETVSLLINAGARVAHTDDRTRRHSCGQQRKDTLM